MTMAPAPRCSALAKPRDRRRREVGLETSRHAYEIAVQATELFVMGVRATPALLDQRMGGSPPKAVTSRMSAFSRSSADWAMNVARWSRVPRARPAREHVMHRQSFR
jgi:hypothetical protein